MADVRLMTHLPLLRIETDDRTAFGDHLLWAVPFEEYDDLLLGSFSDSARAYRATRPVFLLTEVDDVELPDGFREFSAARAAGEQPLISIDSETWLPTVMSFLTEAYIGHRVGAWMAWRALSVALPHVVIPDPLLSLRLIDIEDSTPMGWTVQGDADQELLFLSYAASAPVSRDALARAAALLPAVKRNDGDVGAAIETLCSSGAPSLDDDSQLVLCTTALESLLLPDVTSGVTAAFARRVSNLLGTDDHDRASVAAMAKSLYTARSVAIHGRADGAQADAGSARAMLASAIVAVDSLVSNGLTTDEVRTGIDARPVELGQQGADLGKAKPTSTRPCVKLRVDGVAPSSSSYVLSAGGLTAALPPVEEGELAVFAPLAGLSMPVLSRQVVDCGFPLTWLEPSSITSIEDPDIRRDWLADLAVRGAAPMPTPCLAWRINRSQHEAWSLSSIDRFIEPVRRRRDLAVAVLRLAGLDQFADPELLGEYVLGAGGDRIRLPTIFRQTVFKEIWDPTELLGIEHVDRIVRIWALLDHGDGTLDPEVQRALSMFRHAHHRLGLSAVTRLRMLFACLDIAVGRTDADGYTRALDKLASDADQPDAAALAWYKKHGLATRNAVAHGYWKQDDDGPRGGLALDLVVSVTRASLLSMIASRPPVDSGVTEPGIGAAAPSRYAAADVAVMVARGNSARVAGELDEAWTWYSRASDHGDVTGALNLGLLAQAAGDLDTARRWLTVAADNGVADAMSNLGVLARRRGDFDEARQWYRRAIEAGGEGRAVYNLGVLEQVAGDAELAHELFVQAADLGEHQAMRNLGIEAEHAGDLETAIGWFERAAEAGSANAMNDLGVLAAQSGDMDTAVSWWQRASDAGSSLASLSLGQAARSRGDVVSARRWLVRAVELGNEDASAELADLDASGRGT
ncbi:MAG TPA: tetratricopeptide repeat protein [Microlunatus sp.]